MSKIFPLFALVIILLFSFHLFQNSKNTPQNKITINGKTLFVEIADNDNSRVQGLSNRKKLEKDHGMLFLFPRKDYLTFWMKNMNFPLDIIWIAGNTIIGFEKNVPAEEESPQNLYKSPEPVDKVLELNAGTIDKIAIKKGDKIEVEKR